MRNTVEQLASAVKGEVVMSPELEKVRPFQTKDVGARFWLERPVLATQVSLQKALLRKRARGLCEPFYRGKLKGDACIWSLVSRDPSLPPPSVRDYPL